MLEALIVVGFLDDRLLFLNNKAKLKWKFIFHIIFLEKMVKWLSDGNFYFIYILFADIEGYKCNCFNLNFGIVFVGWTLNFYRTILSGPDFLNKILTVMLLQSYSSLLNISNKNKYCMFMSYYLCSIMALFCKGKSKNPI
jgi:hypothetical protein